MVSDKHESLIFVIFLRNFSKMVFKYFAQLGKLGNLVDILFVYTNYVQGVTAKSADLY